MLYRASPKPPAGLEPFGIIIISNDLYGRTRTGYEDLCDGSWRRGFYDVVWHLVTLEVRSYGTFVGDSTLWYRAVVLEMRSHGSEILQYVRWHSTLWYRAVILEERSYGTCDGRLCGRSQTQTMPRRLRLVASPEQFIRQSRRETSSDRSVTT